MKEEIGKVYVDAGLVWIGDPCYVLGDDASSRVKSWSSFCSQMFAEEAEHPEQNYSQPLGKGIGIAVQSGYGDGAYPVYVTRNDEGRVASLTVEFIGDEEW